MQKWYSFVGGREHGPMPLAEIGNLAKTETLTPNSWIRPGSHRLLRRPNAARFGLCELDRAESGVRPRNATSTWSGN
jgi:hypothetical protein